MKIQSFESPFQNVLKNWSFLTVASVVQTLSGFLCTVRLARVLDANDYGKYALVITVVSILQIFSVLSIRNVVIREISREPSLLKAVSKLSSFLIGISTIICSVLLSIYLTVETGLNDDFIIAGAVVLLVSNSVWTFAETLAFAQQEMRFSSWLSIVGSIAWLLVVFATPEQTLSLRYALISFALVQLARSVSYVAIEIRKKYFKVNYSTAIPENRITAKEILKQSLPILGSAALAIPVIQLPLLFLARFSGMTEVGYYSVGNKLTQPIALLSSTLFHAIYPRLSGSFTNNPMLFRKQAKIFYFFLITGSFVVAMPVSLFSKEIILSLFGSRYESVFHTLSAQVWMIVLWVLNNYWGSLLMASDNERSLLSISLFNSVLIGAASYIGAFYGAFGMAIASFISCALSFGVYGWFIAKTLPGILNDNRLIISAGLLIGTGFLTIYISSYDFWVRIATLVFPISIVSIIYRSVLPRTIREFKLKLNGL